MSFLSRQWGMKLNAPETFYTQVTGALAGAFMMLPDFSSVSETPKQPGV